jgi:hypothetical protein
VVIFHERHQTAAHTELGELVQMELNPDFTKKFARIQRTPEGRLLGVCIFLDAETIGQFVDGAADQIEYRPVVMPSGIILDIAE